MQIESKRVKGRNRIECQKQGLHVAITCTGMALLPFVPWFPHEAEVARAHRTMGLRAMPRPSKNAMLTFGLHDVFVGSVICMLRSVGADVLLTRECADLCYQYEPGQRAWLCVGHEGARLADAMAETDGLAIDLRKQHKDVVAVLTEMAKLDARSKAADAN